MSLGHVRLLVFDMDGVLTDSSAAHARAYAGLWAKIGLADPPRYDDIAGRPTGEVVRELTRGLRPTSVQLAEWTRFKQERAREYLQDIAPFPDVVPSLERLRERGYDMALATSASRGTTTFLLGRMTLERFFEFVITGDDVRAGKPAPEAYQRAISGARGHPESALVVEDSAAGLQAGVAAGASTVSLRTGLTLLHPRFAGAYPDLAALAGALRGPAS